MTYGSATSVAVALVLLIALAVLAMSLGGLHQRADAVGAAARALVQLSLVALVVAWVFTHPAAAFTPGGGSRHRCWPRSRPARL